MTAARPAPYPADTRAKAPRKRVAVSTRVAEAMERSCSKLPSADRALQYFCGICWGKVREQGA